MRIVVAGGSGFLGSALVGACRADGHEVTVLSRRASRPGEVQWLSPSSGSNWTGVLERADAVVNLAGEGIADSRWTETRKRALIESRVAATRALADAIRACAHPPPAFISGSAVGFYGTHGDEVLTEEASSGSDFLAAICRGWEQEAQRAVGVTRVVLLRTGLVLARDDGVLPRMALPFRFLVGGRVGSGRQYMSWIHLSDWVGMVRWALTNAVVSGPLNVTAPTPVTNAAFTRELAGAMRRPAIFPVPPFALRIALGRELADTALLNGQRAIPAKAQQLGYQFSFPTVGPALRDIYS